MPRATFHSTVKVTPDSYGHYYTDNVLVNGARVQSDLNQFLLGQVENIWDDVETMRDDVAALSKDVGALHESAIKGVPPSAVDMVKYITTADATVHALAIALDKRVSHIEIGLGGCRDRMESIDRGAAIQLENQDARIDHLEEVTNLAAIEDLKAQVMLFKQNYFVMALGLHSVNEKLMAQNAALHTYNRTLKEAVVQSGGKLALIKVEELEEEFKDTLNYDPPKLTPVKGIEEAVEEGIAGTTEYEEEDIIF